ncbi:MAG: sulfotransferase family protein [Dongiaceae bacterium]
MALDSIIPMRGCILNERLAILALKDHTGVGTACSPGSEFLMAWRSKIARHAGSSYFMGITLGDWFSLLRENRFAIAPSCLMRAATITMFSIPNSVTCWLESARFQRQWEQVNVAPPLFILGHYRSGTTHLLNLLAMDQRFGFLNSYQASYPDSFLLTEQIGARLLELFLPRSRPFDNVRLSADAPYEDEIAMTNATRVSPYMTVVFPRRRDHYDRYLTFQRASAEEISQWRTGLLKLLQKRSLKDGKPLILKSPPHTCRIKLLLDLFPQAKFVHIHRHPYVVIQSTLHLIRVGLEWIRLQDANSVDWTERALNQWREMYDAYFAERCLIPAGNLHEMAFRDLERDPIGELRRMYESLDLPSFAEVEPRIGEYLATISSYEKNEFGEVTPELKERIVENCRRGFDEWDYDV